MADSIRPVAWLHDIRPESDVITDAVKKLLSQVYGDDYVSHYCIPLANAEELAALRQQLAEALAAIALERKCCDRLSHDHHVLLARVEDYQRQLAEARKVPEALPTPVFETQDPPERRASALSFVNGWNQCRDAMLTAAPTAPVEGE